VRVIKHNRPICIINHIWQLAAVFVLIACAHGQNTGNRQDLNRRDAAKVRAFSNAFLRRLAEAKTIRSIPVGLFDSSSDAAIVRRTGTSRVPDTSMIAPIDLIVRRSLIFDFELLRVLYAARVYMVPGDLELKDIYPPTVIKMLSKDPQLAPMLDLDFETSSISLTQPSTFYTAIERVNSAMRRYLNRHPGEWRRKYWRTVDALDGGGRVPPSAFLCKGEECGSLAQDTRLISEDAFPFELLFSTKGDRFRIHRIAFYGD
jgi:hypothetical protein